MRNKKLKGLWYPERYLNDLTYLALELTPVCDYNCLYCFNGSLDGKRIHELNLNQRKRVIESAVELGAKSLVIPGHGEPLLDPYFIELIKYAHEKGLTSVVFSNFHNIDEKLIKTCEKNDVSWIIKLDSLEKRIYEQIVGKSSYEKVRKNLEIVKDVYKKSTKHYKNFDLVRIAINSIATSLNHSSLPELKKFCEKNDWLFLPKTLVWLGRARDNWGLLVRSNKERKELEKIVANLSTQGVSAEVQDRQCGIYAYGITISYNGNFLICPEARELTLGNIKEEDLSVLIAKRKKLIIYYPGCYVRHKEKGYIR